VPKHAFTVIVPCFNERQGVRRTLESLRANLNDAEDYEIIVVDDGSTDGSSDVLREMVSEDPRLRLIQHSSNMGYGAALKSGIRAARTELLAITDADGTYPVERLGHLIQVLEDGDMVVGARIGKGVQYPFLRRIPKFFLNRYCSFIVRRKIPDLNSGLRVFRRSAAESFLHILPDGFSFTTTITIAMLMYGFRVHYVPITYKPRVGRSKIRPIRDSLNFAQLILRTACYFAPLRVFLPVSVFLGIGFVASLLYDVFVLRDLTEKTLLLLLFSVHAGMFSLLADMIHKHGLIRRFTSEREPWYPSALRAGEAVSSASALDMPDDASDGSASGIALASSRVQEWSTPEFRPDRR
jgi:glycosyltransferase involved in cell wall biosynthesis